MRDYETRVIDLVDEMWEQPPLPEDGAVAALFRRMAERCLDHETEERIALLAFLQHAGVRVPQVIVEHIERGTHRKRSSTAMRAIRDGEAA